MERLILTGFGYSEDDGRSVYFFDKPNELEALNEIWSESGLETFPYFEKGSLKEISNFINYFENKKLDIDFVFTQDKIIIIVRGEPKFLRKFKTLIFKYSDMKQ
ncbi:hypothetical protein HYT91_00955 [Candidatus Pacearchaeota archaeon]|nr:hypothetical protein [Candidatus Pacearchaeota archaeon]